MMSNGIVDIAFKFIILSAFYPMVQVGVYVTTGDVKALSFACVLTFLWIFTLFCFITLFKKDDNNGENPVWV